MRRDLTQPPRFAGHGVQANDTNYLIPVEEVENDELLDYKALHVQHVLERVEAAGCNLNLVLLDACRSKPTAMSRGTRSLGRGLAKIEAASGSVIAFACAPGHTAADGDSRNGVFTSCLLQHLGRPGVDVDFMLGDVATAVEAATDGKQSPFRNHNLKGQRPCCLLTAPDAAPAAPAAPGTTVEDELAAFLAGCRLDTGQQGEVAVALRGIGVTSGAHLDVCEEEDLKQMGLPPIVFKLLRSGLAARAEAGEAKKRIKAAYQAADVADIVAQMKAHAGSAAVQAYACAALRLLLKKRGAKQLCAAAGDAGAAEAVCAAMKAHAGNESMAMDGWQVLIYLTSASDANRQRAVAAGAIDAVLAALAAPQGNSAALLYKAVMDLLQGQVEDSSDEQFDCVDFGDWIYVAVMTRAGVDLQADGVEDTRRFMDAFRLVLGGIAATMRAHTHLHYVQMLACMALESVCDYDGQKKAARDAGLPALLHEAAAKFPSLAPEVTYALERIDAAAEP